MLGEISFDAQGKTWTLVLSINALCLLEEASGKTADEIGDQLLKKPSVTLIRQVFWAALQDHHAGITIPDTGKLIQAIGQTEAGVLLGRAMLQANGEPEAGGEPADPPKAAAAAG